MLITTIAFLFLITFGMPVAFAIGISGVCFFLQHPELPFTMIVQLPVTQTQNYTLLAVPLFILAGNLMNTSGITQRLLNLSSVLVGHMRGGLAQVNVLLSTLMGGVSGSAIADAAMEARILAPAMVKRGYSKGFTANCTAWTGLITATIPPGVGIILYGTTGEVSIGRLFTAGMMVGIVMTAAYMLNVRIISKRRGYMPQRETRAGIREVGASLGKNVWALLFPVILLAGLRTGIFTASEVGAFACIYSLMVGLIAYRELSWRKLTETMGTAVMDMGGVMFIIAMSGIFGYGIPFERIPDIVQNAILGFTANKFTVMGIMLIIMVILGMFMDGSVIILLFTPIFLPMALKVGWDPVHFGILFCTTITLGNMTPPVGMAMYTVCSIMDVPMSAYIREMWPWMLTALIVITVLIFLPGFVLFLPNLLFG